MIADGTHIYAGLTNVKLDAPAYDLGNGVMLTETYAHLMAPHLMAFDRPASKGEHNGGEIRAAQGGFGYDIEVQLTIPRGPPMPGELSVEDTVWWIIVLLRLSHYPFLMAPALCDVPFGRALHVQTPPTIAPYETVPRIVQPATEEAGLITGETVAWLRETWAKGAELLRQEPKLRTAFSSFDHCTVRGRTSSSLLAVWGGLELLFSPSPPSELRFRLAAYIAAYLEPPGAKRLSRYKEVLRLYNARSKAAHAAEGPMYGDLLQSWVVMRNVLMQIVDEAHIPTQDELEDRLFGDEVENSDPT